MEITINLNEETRDLLERFIVSVDKLAEVAIPPGSTEPATKEPKSDKSKDKKADKPVTATDIKQIKARVKKSPLDKQMIIDLLTGDQFGYEQIDKLPQARKKDFIDAIDVLEKENAPSGADDSGL